METTSATCEFCDTYSTLFFAMYFALVAVIVGDAFEGTWRRKAKDSSPQPGAPRPASDSKAGGQRAEGKAETGTNLKQQMPAQE